jgi:hypothetical protein
MSDRIESRQEVTTVETINIGRRPSKPLSFSLSAPEPGAWFLATADMQTSRGPSVIRHDCPLSDAAFPRPTFAAYQADGPIYAANVIRAQGPSVISMAPESVNAGSVGADMQQQTGVSGLAQVARQGGARGVPPRGRPDY